MMNNFNSFGGGFPQFDPSKMDPKILMQMSQLLQQLPPEQLSRMQSLMHNAMAGFDVKKEMEEFERNLPPGFREQIASLMMKQYAQGAQVEKEVSDVSSSPSLVDSQEGLTSEEMSLREARITLLKAVAEGKISPEEAERLLFKA